MHWNLRKPLWALPLIAATAIAAEARAELDAAPRCYLFVTPEGPEGMPHTAAHAHADEATLETWCYLTRTFDGGAETLVYYADADTAKPELAMLVESDAQGAPVSVAFGALSRGELTIHRIDGSDFSPMPAPLTAAGAEKAALAGLSLDRPDVHDAAIELFEILQQGAPESGLRLEVSEGTFESYLDAAKLPYRAYWWPHSGVPLGAGPHSPLGKYDAYVAARTGTSPNSVQWETANHSLQHVPWGGHCNGWAASAVLYPEPVKRLWDPMTRRVFEPSDIEGILAEASFCVQWTFHGTRYRTAADDIADIHPDLFHKTLVATIDGMKKPVAYDYIRDTSVDNNVITGYRMVIVRDPANQARFKVTATVRTHDYDHSRTESRGSAYSSTRTYEYYLTVDEAGRITGGTWISSNPDFLWVPLAQKACGRENPAIDHRKVDELMRSLPEAQAQSLSEPLAATTIDLAPGETRSLGLPVLGGLDFRLLFGAVSGSSGVELLAEGYTRYPTVSDNGVTSRRFTLTSLSNASIALDWQQITALKLVNRGSAAASATVAIRRIDYVGGP